MKNNNTLKEKVKTYGILKKGKNYQIELVNVEDKTKVSFPIVKYTGEAVCNFRKYEDNSIIDEINNDVIGWAIYKK